MESNECRRAGVFPPIEGGGMGCGCPSSGSCLEDAEEIAISICIFYFPTIKRWMKWNYSMFGSSFIVPSTSSSAFLPRINTHLNNKIGVLMPQFLRLCYPRGLVKEPLSMCISKSVSLSISQYFFDLSHLYHLHLLFIHLSLEGNSRSPDEATQLSQSND